MGQQKVSQKVLMLLLANDSGTSLFSPRQLAVATCLHMYALQIKAELEIV